MPPRSRHSCRSASGAKHPRIPFHIYYKAGSDHLEYQPDFVAETASVIYMLEPKARNELQSDEVQAKRVVAEEWCARASVHAKSYGGKGWKYALIPHDIISENMTVEGLVAHLIVE